MNVQIARAVAVALAVLLLTAGCQLPDSGEFVSAEGTVRHLEIEGGCWVIETRGETYEPLNLPTDLREDGLRVRFEAEVRRSVATVCQVGPVIEVREIERSS